MDAAATLAKDKKCKGCKNMEVPSKTVVDGQ